MSQALLHTTHISTPNILHNTSATSLSSRRHIGVAVWQTSRCTSLSFLQQALRHQARLEPPLLSSAAISEVKNLAHVDGWQPRLGYVSVALTSMGVAVLCSAQTVHRNMATSREGTFHDSLALFCILRCSPRSEASTWPMMLQP